MAKIIYKTKLLKKEDKKKVRNFIKDYDTEGLTIIFSERWDERVYYRSKGYKWKSMGSCIGRYHKKGDGYKMGACGIKNIGYPIILVKVEKEIIDCMGKPMIYVGYDWWDTFLHEFGHYLNDILDNGIIKHKHKEQYAETFASMMKKKDENS